MNKKVITIFLIFIMLLPLTACKNQFKTENTDTITFTDALNRKVSVKKNPERVGALLGSFADIWVLAGGTLCASAEDAWEDFGLESETCLNIGGAHSPSLEKLVSADPDFVIASASTASNIDMKESLEAMNITVAYFDVDNFSDYLYMLDICTDITGRKDLYEQNGISLKTQIDKIKTQYAGSDIPSAEKKILLLRASSTSVKAKGSSGTILGEMLFDMGCINIADSALIDNLSVEAVIREQPYHVFVVTMGDTEKAKQSLENLIKENPAWSTLEAIKNNRLHLMDKRLFNLKPNSRWAESYEILYENLTEK